MAAIDRLFDIMIEQDGSDLHLVQGEKPKIRLHGSMFILEDEPPLEEDVIRSLLEEILEPDRWREYLQLNDYDFAYEKDEVSRFRANYYRTVGGYGAVFRIIPTEIVTLEDLKLPPALKKFALLRSGLVLVTGPTGSGKSTTLAAIINHINETSSRYILTIEEPIEFVHPSKKCVFCQREVGIDTLSFADALRTSTRQDCDVILVGEMRDYETISLAISAAAMGTLVFGTLHTNSAIKTIDRVIDSFPTDEQDQARSMLAESLKGVCAQLLLKRADKGRVAVNEILLTGEGLSACIREGNLSNIYNIIKSGKSKGMQMMDDSIEHYLNQGAVTREEAYLKSHDKKRFAQQ